jgi:magnesium chelatase family protein
MLAQRRFAGVFPCGLPHKPVLEARDRVRSALASMAIALPSKRITVNLSPADLP